MFRKDTHEVDTKKREEEKAHVHKRYGIFFQCRRVGWRGIREREERYRRRRRRGRGRKRRPAEKGNGKENERRICDEGNELPVDNDEMHRLRG